MSVTEFEAAAASVPANSQRRIAGFAVTPLAAGLFVILVLGLFILLFPAGFTRDYLNHLARTHIEANLGADPDLQRHYGLSFALIPDLTMDMIIPWLSKLAGTWKAGALTIWMALALPAAAGLLISHNVHGRVGWFSLAGFLTVFGIGAEWGFVNYVASSGVALLAFALWMRMQPGLLRSLVFAPLGLLLAFNHALAFLAFGFMALLWEAASYAEGERGTASGFVGRAFIFDLPATLPGLAIIALATLGADDLPQGTADFFSLSQKVQGLMGSFAFFNPLLGLVIFMTIAGSAVFLLHRRYVSMPRKMAIVVGGLAVLVLLAPTSILGIWGLHLRFTGLLAIVFFASIEVTPRTSALVRQSVGGIFAAVLLAALINGGWQMSRLDRQTDETRALLQSLPRGAKLLAAYDTGPLLDFPFAMHSSAIAVIERSAYVPGLFTNTSPVDVAPDMVDLHMPQSLPLSLEQLAARANMAATPSANGYWSPAYANAWPERWDYLLFFRGQAEQEIDGLPVCKVGESPMAVLYRTGDC